MRGYCELLHTHTCTCTLTNMYMYVLCDTVSVLMIRFCLYSGIMSDHAKFELTFTKVGTICDASIDSTHTVMAHIILVSYQCPDNLSV